MTTIDTSALRFTYAAPEGAAWLQRRSSGEQFGEQGILSAVIEALEPYIPADHRWAVEFGAGDGAALPLMSARVLDRHGWRGLLIDSVKERCDALQKNAPSTATIVFGAVSSDAASVMCIDRVMASFGCPTTPGLMVVDVDSVEYYIVQSMRARPYVLCVEHHNAACSEYNDGPEIPPMEECGREFDSSAADGSGVGAYTRQANAEAMVELTRSMGYTLVWRSGINGVYVRDDMLEKVFIEPQAVSIESQPVRLNIGAGRWRIPGFVALDIGTGTDARKLDYQDNSVDEVYTSHMLEHVSMKDTLPMLREWFRVLKPGGRLRVAVPDLAYWCKKYVEGDASAICIGHLYGGQTDEHDFHKNGYDELGLRFTLQQAGFICCRRFKPEYQDDSSLPISLNMECNKPTSSIVNGQFTKKICAAMTLPRLGFTENFCAIDVVLKEQKISLDTITGAYYDQGIEWAIENALKNKPDYVLTIDYDTIFDVSTLHRMMLLADNYSEYDAFVPCQVRRGNEYCMFNVKDNDKAQKINYYDTYPIQSGHFGFTLFRAEAFAKMAKPWFKSIEAPDGKGWGGGKIDADINFWNKWREAGNTIALCARVSVGHVETMVSWPGEDFRPIYQHTGEWREHGKPPGAR